MEFCAERNFSLSLLKLVKYESSKAEENSASRGKFHLVENNPNILIDRDPSDVSPSAADLSESLKKRSSTKIFLR